MPAMGALDCVERCALNNQPPQCFAIRELASHQLAKRQSGALRRTGLTRFRQGLSLNQPVAE